MKKKTEKRQSLIVSLSDENQQKLANIEKQRLELLEDFEGRKKGNSAKSCNLYMYMCLSYTDLM